VFYLRALKVEATSVVVA